VPVAVHAYRALRASIAADKTRAQSATTSSCP